MNQPRKDNGQFGSIPPENTAAEAEEAFRQKRQEALNKAKAYDDKTKAWHKRNMDRAFGNPTVLGD